MKYLPEKRIREEKNITHCFSSSEISSDFFFLVENFVELAEAPVKLNINISADSEVSNVKF